MKKFLGIFALLFLFSIGLVSAAGTVTIGTPTVSAQLGGASVFLNVSFDKTLGEAEGNDTLYCVPYIVATGSYLSANTTAVIANAEFVNISDSVAQANMTLLPTVEDGRYTLTVYCGNSTTESNESATVTVYVDNSIPQIPTAMTPASGTESFARTQTFAWTVEGNDTTKCILSFADSAIRPGTGIYEFAPSGNDCSKTISIAGGSYTFKGGASDETNTTYIATQTLTMSSASSGGVSYVPSGDGAKGNIVVIALVVAAAFLLFGKKKK